MRQLTNDSKRVNATIAHEPVSGQRLVPSQKVDQPATQRPPQQPVRHAGPADIAAAAQLITDAKHPVVLVGGGAASTSVAAAATEFAARTGIGVVAIQMAKGVVPESHPLSMTTLGIHRPDYAHLSILPADIVMAVGYQPVEHPPLAWNPSEDKSIVHLDVPEPRVERGYQPLRHLTSTRLFNFASGTQLKSELSGFGEVTIRA